MAGIVYNARVGDPAYGWAGDHVEPGREPRPPRLRRRPRHALSGLYRQRGLCGQAARRAAPTASSRANTPGCWSILPPDVLELLTVGDRIVIKTCGRGMKLLDHPGVLVKKAGPNLIEQWGLRDCAGWPAAGAGRGDDPRAYHGQRRRTDARIRRPGPDDRRPRRPGRTWHRPTAAGRPGGGHGHRPPLWPRLSSPAASPSA